jgi:translation initiation factor 6
MLIGKTITKVRESSHNIIKELGNRIHVIYRSIADYKIIGRMCGGNKRGLKLQIYGDMEWQVSRFSLPDLVRIREVEGRLSSFGNRIAVNYYFDLIQLKLDKNTEEII